jgi:ATP-binding cassette subfamily B protein
MRLAQRTQHDLRVDAYTHLQDREMAFFEEQRTGNLLSTLNDDINQLERFLNGVFTELIHLFILVLVAGASMISVSWKLGLITMMPIPFMILGSFYYQRKIAPFYKQVRDSVGALNSRLENNLGGILVIKSFVTETFEAERVRQASLDYRDANFKAIRWSSVYIPLIRILICVGFAAALMIGAYWAIHTPQRFSIGDLAFFAMMTERLLWPITRLGSIFDDYERARAASRRIFGLLDAPNTILNPDHPIHLPANVGQISLKNVRFGYRPDRLVLDDISLNIPAGQTIGIAGPTGGGKTTLIKLLLRLYDVSSGAILLNGIDIREVELQELRRNIGLVTQEVYLFHGTIRENIAYGVPDADDEAIFAAAKQAQLHDFILQLPQQYDALIGERGIKLSGGQRQRLSIARAILKNAPILILDEATSAVDTETERAIQESLRELTRNKTAIIIAHRLSTIRNADNIFVIKDGKIAETGSHDELIQKDGIYAGLWNVQIGLLEVE